MQRTRLIKIIDGEDPTFGRLPGLALNGLIFFSAIVIAAETVQTLPEGLRVTLGRIEFFLLAVFLAEYTMRLVGSENPLRYALSFWGIVDFLACVPALLFLLPDLQTIRVFRLLRLLRLLKLFRANRSLERLARAYASVREELAVFTFIALVILYLASVGIYHFERSAQPDTFSSIPASLWWAVATLTTVGYGDAYPITVGGQMFTGVVLLIGLGVIAVPVGLITSALLDTDSLEAESRKTNREIDP